MLSDTSNAALVLDQMIAQAEAACDRYRVDLERRHSTDNGVLRRRLRLATMEHTLERLRAQRVRERG